MKIGLGGKTALGVAIGFALLLAWYAVAADYDYKALAGTYIFDKNGVKCTLKLDADQTFAQEIDSAGHQQIVEGQWRRYGESHMSFSSQFITLPGEELNGAGEAHGQFEKTFGIFPSLVLAPLPNGPAFRRLLFR